MSWIYYNPNPKGNLVGDCVIRALTLACGQDWDETYLQVTMQGYLIKDMPSSNITWSVFLKHRGFRRYVIPAVGMSITHMHVVEILATVTKAVMVLTGTVIEEDLMKVAEIALMVTVIADTVMTR